MAVGPIKHGIVKSIPGYDAEPFDGEVANGTMCFMLMRGLGA
jgi:hypothetical protein